MERTTAEHTLSKKRKLEQCLAKHGVFAMERLVINCAQFESSGVFFLFVSRSFAMTRFYDLIVLSSAIDSQLFIL